MPSSIIGSYRDKQTFKIQHKLGRKLFEKSSFPQGFACSCSCPMANTGAISIQYCIQPKCSTSTISESQKIWWTVPWKYGIFFKCFLLAGFELRSAVANSCLSSFHCLVLFMLQCQGRSPYFEFWAVSNMESATSLRNNLPENLRWWGWLFFNQVSSPHGCSNILAWWNLLSQRDSQVRFPLGGTRVLMPCISPHPVPWLAMPE